MEPVTAENWPGGYDENGDYTGYDEYDENGNYVGPKPMTALDYALESWVGGYDEEGDYTGAGEYDVVHELCGTGADAGDAGRHGRLDGRLQRGRRIYRNGEYDREGNYVGPNPNGSLRPGKMEVRRRIHRERRAIRKSLILVEDGSGDEVHSVRNHSR